jgi:hypothetical protein
MRSLTILSSLLVLSAAGVVGCGGGPCADYCAATLECATANAGCELADPGEAQRLCTDACVAGLDNVPQAEDRNAVQQCLGCLAPYQRESCELTQEDVLKCDDECLPAVNALDPWLNGFSAELSDETILCTDGTPVGGGNCSLSSSGTTCSVDCESGGMTVGAQCDGTTGTFTCQCTAGAQQGTSFSSDCDALDPDVVWEVCN